MEAGTAIALTIAGSDSGGGAGIQADLKTFSALGVYGASAITALTAQNTQGVQGIFNVPASFVGMQIESVFQDLPPLAVKIGMLSDTDIINSVAERLRHFNASNIVLDPVMIATSGDTLLQQDAVSSLKLKLFPLAALVTPNLQEAAVLVEEPIALTEKDMEKQAFKLIRMGAQAVLLKGGHGTGAESVDILVFDGKSQRLASPRIKTRNTHGTGCTLSSAITAYLAYGLDLENAVNQAKVYITGTIEASNRLNIGQDNLATHHGPTHHFFKWW